MLAIKPAFALLALGLGGLLSTTGAPPAAPAAPMTTPVATAASTAMPQVEQLAAAVRDTLQQQVRADLDDQDATVVLGHLDTQRASGRSLEARGAGFVRLPGAESIPVEVVGVYDLADGRLERVDYTAHPVAVERNPVDRAMRAALGRRIGERIAADFQDQPSHFELLEVVRVGYGPHRTQLKGAGLTDFGPEGAVFTPFVATLDQRTGDVVALTYDLVQDAGQPTSSSALIAAETPTL